MHRLCSQHDVLADPLSVCILAAYSLLRLPIMTAIYLDMA
jgi:hypothetical protein